MNPEKPLEGCQLKVAFLLISTLLSNLMILFIAHFPLLTPTPSLLSFVRLFFLIQVVLQRTGKSDKTLAKTKAIKTKSLEAPAQWNECFLLTDLDPSDYLLVEVEDSRTVGHKVSSSLLSLLPATPTLLLLSFRSSSSLSLRS